MLDGSNKENIITAGSLIRRNKKKKTVRNCYANFSYTQNTLQTLR